MGRQQRVELLPNNLVHLQNLLKKDPESYRDEYQLQWRHYIAQRDLLYHADATAPSEEFLQMLTFLGHVSSLYPDVSTGFVDDLEALIQLNATFELKEKVVHVLRLLRNKNAMSAER
jgi:protein SDA1